MKNNYYTRKPKIDRLKRFLCYKHGKDNGMKRFYSLSKGHNLKYMMFAFGKIEGKKMYDNYHHTNSIKGTKEFYIDKYGEVLGIERYLQKNKKLSVSISALKANGYSDVEITKIKATHANKSARTLKNYTDQYGAIDGEKLYKKYQTENRVSVRSVKELMSRKGLSREEAECLVKIHQIRNESFFIKKYGESIGKEKFSTMNLKRAFAMSEQYYKDTYGDMIGKDLWQQRLKACSKAEDVNYWIEKHGDGMGRDLYDSFCKSRLKASMTIIGNSKPQKEMAQLIYDNINPSLQKQFSGAPVSKQTAIHVNHLNCRWCVPDVKICNIIIEFDGDYWHSLAENVKRDLIKNEAYNHLGFKVLRVKESVWKKNKQQTLEMILNFIKENINEDTKNN